MGNNSKQRLREIYSAVMGANVALLPTLAIYLATHAKIGTLASVAIWILTTIIVVNEWWATLSIWEHFPPSAKPGFFEVYQIIANLMYVLPIIFLPASLFLEKEGTLSLGYYAWCLLILPVIDLLIVVPHASIDKEQYNFVLYYAIADFIAIGLFLTWIFAINTNPEISLFLKTLALSGFYLSEYIMYYGCINLGPQLVKRLRSTNKTS